MISTENIADEFFKKNFKKSENEKQWLDVENPRFINWMKISSKSTFRKLWGTIEEMDDDIL